MVESVMRKAMEDWRIREIQTLPKTCECMREYPRDLLLFAIEDEVKNEENRVAEYEKLVKKFPLLAQAHGFNDRLGEARVALASYQELKGQLHKMKLCEPGR